MFGRIGLKVTALARQLLKAETAAAARATLGAAGKVGGATADNLAALDANGDLTDSGKSPASFVASSEKGAANGVATLNASGEVEQSSSLGAVLGAIRVYDTPGSYTWNRPAGLKYVIVTVVGAGGAGGGALSGTTGASAGSGGGGGASAKVLIDASALGASETVTVGAGGVGAAGADGGAGGASSFGSHVSCGGGAGGLYGPDSGSSGVGVAGGAGGNVTISSGTKLLGADGMPGAPARYTSAYDGGASGAGGGCSFGIGATCKGWFDYGDGIPGAPPGGGGSGAYNRSSSTVDRPGGNGADGLVIVEEYY